MRSLARDPINPVQLHARAAGIPGFQNFSKEQDLWYAEADAERYQIPAALLLAHAALRQLARGRDGLALPSCIRSLEDRLRIGQLIRPFPPELSRGGDPMGDAYHDVANLCVGVLARQHPRFAWAVPLFSIGPELMLGVRQHLMGSPLFFGNHARVDRLGLLHGLQMGARVSRASRELSRGVGRQRASCGGPGGRAR